MLQTLSDMKDKEIERLVKDTNEEIEKIGNDFRTTMRLLGATPDNQNPSWIQKSLMIYPELFRDDYARQILKQTKKSLVKQARAGRLRVNGYYCFMVNDPYAICEHWFLGIKNPQGLLKENECYNKIFRNNDELACLRSPHLYREWVIKVNKRNEELDKWFGETKCIYFGCNTLSSKVLQNDNDGDMSLIVKNDLLTRIAKRNIQNIVPLAYNLRKAKPSIINNEVLYNGMIKAYTSGNIGPISNNLSKIFNSGKEITQKELDCAKRLTYWNNAVIDTSKTNWLPTFPDYIKQEIKTYTKAKVPHFFIYAKDKTEAQVEPINNSVMNRISSAIASSRVKYSKSIGKLDYRMLMNNSFNLNIASDNPIVNSYNYWNKHQFLFNTQDENHVNQEDMYIFQKIRENIIADSGEDINYIVNTLVNYLYGVKQATNKKTLWACFGDILYNNLCENLKDSKDKICPICGKRFQPRQSNQEYCSEECSKIYRREYLREKQAEFRNKHKK